MNNSTAFSRARSRAAKLLAERIAGLPWHQREDIIGARAEEHRAALMARRLSATAADREVEMWRRSVMRALAEITAPEDPDYNWGLALRPVGRRAQD